MSWSELCFSNANTGYLEGLLRGLRSGFLNVEGQRTLEASELMSDVKMTLESTDQKSFFINEKQDIKPYKIRAKCKEKLQKEWAQMLGNAPEPLHEFLKYCTYPIMIDNCVLIIQGRKVNTSMEILKQTIDPIGQFEEIDLLAVDTELSDLFSTVLIDSPIGKYFEMYLFDNSPEGQDNKDLNTIIKMFNEVNTDILKAKLKKQWLEDFYLFSMRIGGETARVMDHILKFEADTRTIQILYNSYSSRDKNKQDFGKTRIQEKKKLCNKFGYLYPIIHDRLFKEATDFNKLKDCVREMPCQTELLRDVSDPSQPLKITKDLTTELSKEEARLYSNCFQGQFHYGIFQAYLKLKEQEIKNIHVISEMIERKQDKTDAIFKRIVIPFIEEEHAGEVAKINAPKIYF